MKLPILLNAIVSDDGKRCAPECPLLFEPKDEDGGVDAAFCLLPNEADLAYDEEEGWLRNTACIAASAAAVEAEVSAMREGFEIAQVEHAGWMPEGREWERADRALDKAIEARRKS